MACFVHVSNVRVGLHGKCVHDCDAGDTSSPIRTESYVEEIRQLCLKKGQRREKPHILDWQAASHIEDAFHTRYNGIETSICLGFAEDTPAEYLLRRLRLVSEMFLVLQSLAKGFCAPASLAIAKTINFYWKDHFAKSPIFPQILA